MRILGLESSCDETAVAVIDEHGSVLSDAIASQHEVHAPFMGVVPELASRAHTRHVGALLAGLPCPLHDIDLFVATQGPGLTGALLTGLSVGKTLAMIHNKPFVGVDHLEAHLLAVFLKREASREAKHMTEPEFPFIGLLVSGGHTALYVVTDPNHYELLGQTRDDAAGEAYDKFAKMLQLGYPGGPLVDRLAQKASVHSKARSGIVWDLPRPMRGNQALEFSFSGLKTAASREIETKGIPDTEDSLVSLCALFQERVTSVLVEKSVQACEERGIRRLVLAGGVAANQGLKHRAEKACALAGISLFVPPPISCTDNAAMIAYRGLCDYLANGAQGLDGGAYSRARGRMRGSIRP